MFFIVTTVVAYLSWYDPALGGINCDADCTRLADGSPVAAWYDRAIACPPEFALGAQIDIPGVGVRECRDRGGAIQCHLWGCVFDVLTQTPIRTGFVSTETGLLPAYPVLVSLRNTPAFRSSSLPALELPGWQTGVVQ